jgi:two-component system chemotaxis response regulator CheB
VVVRRILNDLIAADPRFEVVGTASTGKIALARLDQLSPDIVTLDVEMPDLDGVGTLREIRKGRPNLAVLMVSSLTEKGGHVTLEALAAGASDYILKPFASGKSAEVIRQFGELLITKLEALSSQKTKPLSGREPVRPMTMMPTAAAPKKLTPLGPVDVLAIGASTGGPNAVAQILSALPADLPVPIVITQHMPATFTRLFADRLRTSTPVHTQEGYDGLELVPGRAIVAPGDRHMTFVRDGRTIRVALNQDAPENSVRPAVDVMFRSAAAMFDARILAVVLTGMGRDGLRGAELIAEAGGQIVVQDEASSVVWGMPGFIAKAGLADAILPLDLIAGEITKRITSSAYMRGRTSTQGAEYGQRIGPHVRP